MVFAMSAEPPIIDQAQLTAIICERSRNFAWFPGAGASRTAGLPTATDIIQDLKRRSYCQLTIAALAVIASAVEDALSPPGVQIRDLPITRKGCAR
jgi:hypothetical protein